MWWIPLVAITQGIATDADPAVVAIVRTDGTLRCSGTVIAERVVLTAAHCGVHVEPSAFRVLFGNELGTTTAIEVVEAIAHPAFDATESHDLALVLLADAALAPPVAMSSIAPAGQLRIVGFGDTAGGANDATRKRTGTTSVASSSATAIVLAADPSLPCTGDSGGPAFAGETIVAVISRGDASCAANGKATRVDAHLADFIAPYVIATAPGTRAVGERCSYDAHCTSNSCVVASDEPLSRYCSDVCARDSDCPDAMDCSANTCRYREPTPGAIGATCEADDECIRGECTDDGYCSVRCVSGRGDCPDGFECAHRGGVDFFCTPIPDEGGCCDASGHSGAGALLFALGLYVTTGRRRSSRRDPYTRCRSRSSHGCSSRGCSGSGTCARACSPSSRSSSFRDSRCCRSPSPRCSR